MHGASTPTHGAKRFSRENGFTMHGACTTMHKSVHAQSMHGAFSVDIYITMLRGVTLNEMTDPQMSKNV